MHIELAQKTLLDALSRAVLAAEAKSTNMYYATVLIDADEIVLDADEASLRLAATTGILALDTTIEATIREPGAVAVNARQLQTLTAAMPVGPVQLKLQPDGKRVTFTGIGKRKYTLAALPATGFPVITQPADDAPQFEIDSKALLTILDRVGHAMADSGRPHLYGVEIVSEGDKLAGAAMSSAMLASARIPYSGPELRLFLPALLHRPLRALCERSKTVRLSRDERWVFVETDDTLLASLVPNDGFADWRMIMVSLSKSSVHQCKVDSEQLVALIRAVSAARVDLDHNISLKLAGGEMLISLTGAAASGEDTIAVDGGGTFVFVADPDRLMATLKPVNGIASLALTANDQPCVVTSDDGYAAVVMPILTGG